MPVAVCLLVLAALPAVGTPVDLGGPRQARAVVAERDGRYVVTVRMRAVRAFDPATNARLNREKARGYALRALVRVVAGRADGRLTVRRAEVVAAGPDGRQYALTLSVAKDNVSAPEEDP
ncbi:MAG: hypothetical protein K2X87_03535 [Gemmataceae bacterium]|nr:hypothetical protein [Gemmataceae bacterium]